MRLHLEQEFRRPPGTRRPHPPDEPRDGGGRRRHRSDHRCSATEGLTMEPFRMLSGMAAPLPEANIDTDIIFPAQIPSVARQEGARRASVQRARGRMVRKRIGASSSTSRHSSARKSWSLAPTSAPAPAASRRCGRSPTSASAALSRRASARSSSPTASRTECCRSYFPQADHDEVMAQAQAARPISIDLEAQLVRLDAGRREISFEIDAYRKRALLDRPRRYRRGAGRRHQGHRNFRKHPAGSPPLALSDA